jgi:biopolymer transport protein ExbD
MKKKEIDPEFELNIASIIDCFTVLITYLLLSASFITLGIFDVTVASSSPPDKVDTTTPPPKLTVTIGLLKNNDIRLNTDGSETSKVEIPNKDGSGDFDVLTANLQRIKEKFPDLSAAMITAEDSVNYREVVKAVAVTRATLPQIALSAEMDNQI